MSRWTWQEGLALVIVATLLVTEVMVTSWVGQQIVLQVTAPTPAYSAPGPPPNPTLVAWCMSGQSGYLVEWIWPVWGTYPGGPPAIPPVWQYSGPSVNYRFLSRVKGSLSQADLVCQVPIGGQVTVR